MYYSLIFTDFLSHTPLEDVEHHPVIICANVWVTVFALKWGVMYAMLSFFVEMQSPKQSNKSEKRFVRTTCDDINHPNYYCRESTIELKLLLLPLQEAYIDGLLSLPRCICSECNIVRFRKLCSTKQKKSVVFTHKRLKMDLNAFTTICILLAILFDVVALLNWLICDVADTSHVDYIVKMIDFCVCSCFTCCKCQDLKDWRSGLGLASILWTISGMPCNSKVNIQCRLNFISL